MSLRERLARANTGGVDTGSNPAAATNVKDEIKRSVHYLLIEEMGAELDSASGEDVGVRLRIERKLRELMDQEPAVGYPLLRAVSKALVQRLYDTRILMASGS